ncbi:MAG: hypothetical protein AB7T74_13045 [Clostridia bacterium]|jgi:hypothetical protein|nr:hypothetical protein [Spirochaetia bacterium]
MKTRLSILLLLAAATASAFGAGLSVPDFRILTNGRVNNGALVLSSRVYTDLLIEGGSKFSASFKLGFQTDDLESYLNALTTPVAADGTSTDQDLAILDARSGLMFRSAAITMNGAFGTPLETTVFVGRMDPFASGDDFPILFGTADFATRLRGYMYYPDGIGGDQTRYYNGLHEAYGTGLRLSLPGDRLKPYLYLYQDAWIGPGNYSVDARILFNTEKIKLEGFAGASNDPDADLGVYRGGFLFFFDTGDVGAFYAQIGVPRWDPTETFGMDMLFFMFEPRVDFGAGTLTLSLFFHPAWYLQVPTEESGALDMRVDFSLGKLAVSGLQAGVETLISYDPNDTTSPDSSPALVVEVSPYFNSIRDGVRWDLKLGIQAVPFFEDVWYEIFRPSIGITTAF